MNISAAHIGALLCLYQTGARIRILSADDLHVTYQAENGEHYTTRGHHFDAFLDPDPVRRDLFDANSQYGLALLSAELGALKVLLSNPFASRSEQELAERALSIVASQKEELARHINEAQLQEQPSHEHVIAFLDALYEAGTGSHDTFYGQRVENVSQFHGHFQIGSEVLDYGNALLHLSKPTQPNQGRKLNLDTQISQACIQRNTLSHTNTPTASKRAGERCVGK